MSDLDDTDDAEPGGAIALIEPGELAVQAEPLALFMEKAAGCMGYLVPYVGRDVLTPDVCSTIEVRLRDWRLRFGVTSEDVAEACRALVTFDALGAVMGRPTMLAAFTRALGKAHRRRTEREAAARQAAEREERLRNPVPRGPDATPEQLRQWWKACGHSDERVLELLAGIGTPVGGGRKTRPAPVRGDDRGSASEEGRGSEARGEDEGDGARQAEAGPEAVEQRQGEGGEAQGGHEEGRVG